MNSCSYFVRYDGQTEHAEEFRSLYRHRHVPIVGRLPGLQRILLHTPVAWQDPFPVKPDRFVLTVQMVFVGQDDLDKALRSEARAAARDDFRKFPSFRGLVYHQGALSEEVFRNGECSGNER